MNANEEMLAGYADTDADLCIRIMSLCCKFIGHKAHTSD